MTDGKVGKQDLTQGVMVVIAAEPGQGQQFPGQRIERQAVLDASQSSIGDLGTFGEFHYDANISAPAERNHHQLTRKGCDVARAVIEQRLQWNVESYSCDGH